MNELDQLAQEIITGASKKEQEVLRAAYQAARDSATSLLRKIEELESLAHEASESADSSDKGKSANEAKEEVLKGSLENT
jgi:hypothetical protein